MFISLLYQLLWNFKGVSIVLHFSFLFSSMGKTDSSETVATICSYVHMRIDSILSVTVYYIATAAVFMIH